MRLETPLEMGRSSPIQIGGTFHTLRSLNRQWVWEIDTFRYQVPLVSSSILFPSTKQALMSSSFHPLLSKETMYVVQLCYTIQKEG